MKIISIQYHIKNKMPIFSKVRVQSGAFKSTCIVPCILTFRQLLSILILLLVFSSCNNQADQQKKLSRVERFKDQNIVVTALAQRGTFYREFESNGKLQAVKRAIIHYELDEKIISVDVKNGQRVSRGQILSVLDNVEQLHRFEKSVSALERSRLNLEDALINMGYQLSDSLSIPESMMNVALVRSGYRDAEGEKKMANILLSKTEVKAPFNGVVAGLQAKAYNKSGQYKEFCTLIDDTRFEIEFPVLENEAFKLSEGLSVAVIPFAFDSDTINGYLSAINPMVSETGMVLAKAIINNKSGSLFEGMNLKVIIREAIPNKIIVPKSAVTLRQERKVVFVCKNDTAHWRYVNVGEENMKFCTLKGKAVKPVLLSQHALYLVF